MTVFVLWKAMELLAVSFYNNTGAGSSGYSVEKLDDKGWNMDHCKLLIGFLECIGFLDLLFFATTDSDQICGSFSHPTTVLIIFYFQVLLGC